MNKLSDRLKEIALEIDRGETMADIGTDHGFLPLYLYGAGICPQVILTDISRASLQKSIDNCEREKPGEIFDCRLGDGLQVLGPGEVDTVVIAGMGGILITEILGADLEKARTYGKFILQPRNAVGELRHWLFYNGFSIAGEKLVREGKFICEILTVLPRPEKVADFSMGGEKKNSIKWEVPRKYGDPKDELTKDYLKRKLAREEKIHQAMGRSKRADRGETEKNIQYLRSLLEPAK